MGMPAALTTRTGEGRMVDVTIVTFGNRHLRMSIYIMAYKAKTITKVTCPH
jgi:hypothetical protein